MKIEETELIEFFGTLPDKQSQDEQEFFGTMCFTVSERSMILTVCFCEHESEIDITLSEKDANKPIYSALHRKIEEFDIRERPDGVRCLRITSGNNVVFVSVKPIQIQIKERC